MKRKRNGLLLLSFVIVMTIALILSACGAAPAENRLVANKDKVEEALGNDSLKDSDETKQNENGTNQDLPATVVEPELSKDDKFREYIAENNISLKARDVLFDMKNSLDQTFAITGNAELSTYYNYGFRNLEKTHFAVSIEDEGQDYSDRWVLYFDRDEFRGLYEILKKTGKEDFFVIASGIIPSAHYKDGQDELALGTDILYEKPSGSFDESMSKVEKEYSAEKEMDLKAIDVLYDMQNHLDQDFLVSGNASLDTYYNYGFRSLEETHFAVKIDDQSSDEYWVLYFDRQQFSDLFETLKQSEQYITATAVIPSSNYKKGQDELALGKDAKIK